MTTKEETMLNSEIEQVIPNKIIPANIQVSTIYESEIASHHMVDNTSNV